MAPGDYTVQIGRSAVDVVAEATVTLVGDDVVPALTMSSSVSEWFEHPVVGARFLERFLAAMPGGAADQHDGMLRMIGSMPMRRFATDLGQVLPVVELELLMAEAQAARAR